MHQRIMQDKSKAKNIKEKKEIVKKMINETK